MRSKSQLQSFGFFRTKNRCLHTLSLQSFGFESVAFLECDHSSDTFPGWRLSGVPGGTKGLLGAGDASLSQGEYPHPAGPVLTASPNSWQQMPHLGFTDEGAKVLEGALSY